MNKMSSIAPGRAAVRSLGRLAALSLCLSFASFAPARADTPVEADPPDRVARLSFIQGEVSLQPAGAEEWTTAIVNRPLTTGDKLWTDQGARAEIYVGPAAVRLGSDTGFSFLNVDDDTIQMRMTAGVVNVRVRSLDEHDQIEIDTPNLALSLLRPGNYRVEVNDEGDTTVVKVIDGEAEVSGGSQDVIVHAQQAATFRGTEQLAAQFGTLGAPDEFDSWSLERDRRDERVAASPSAQYVSPDVTGYEDLDANGTWSSDPEYGYVWTPTVVAVDWSPYRYGRWVWIAPWGWTWIDDAPWGFAPFHYGRWAHVRDRWCWVPGPRHVRAVYAPALVAWVGTPGVSVSITVGGGGGVAWFPLGPREVYVPARRFSPRYVERVNVTNTVIVNNTYITNVYNNNVTNVTYRNRAVPGAVTAVSRTTFTSAEPVGRHMVRIDEREITRVRATSVAPQIQPARQSVLGESEAARRNVRTPPPAVLNRQVVAKRAPPPSAAHFVRNAGQPAIGREQADRLHRLQDRPDRNESAGRNQPNVRNDANARVEATPRDQASRTRQPQSDDRPGRDASREAALAAERERAAREAAAARNDQARRDERPPQGQIRTDRPPRADQPLSPDHIHRGPPNEQPAQSDRPREDRPARVEQPTQLDRAREDRPARVERPARIEQPAQVDRPREDRPAMRVERNERRQPIQQNAPSQPAAVNPRAVAPPPLPPRQPPRVETPAPRQPPRVESQPPREPPRMERPSRPEPPRQAEQNKPQPQPQPQERERRRPQQDDRQP